MNELPHKPQLNIPVVNAQPFFHGSLFSGIGGLFIQNKFVYLRMKNNIYKCSYCGSDFRSYNPNPKYCSLTCKGNFQSAGIDFEKAKELYESGLSQTEVALKLDTSQKAIYSLFARNKYKARVAAKRDQRGYKNTSWKGDKATYSALHFRVESQRGKPSLCSVCNRSDNGTYYEWANLTGKYEDVNDYARMCRKCHRQYDKERPNSSKHISKKQNE